MAELSHYLIQLSLIRSKSNWGESKDAVPLTDECVWDTDESPWWRWCFWSLRIHAAPPCLTWLIKRDGARLPVLALSPPAWQLQSPWKRGRPRLHLGRLLMEPICSQLYQSFFFYIPFGEGQHILSAKERRDYHKNTSRTQPYSHGLKANKPFFNRNRSCRAKKLTGLWIQPREAGNWMLSPRQPGHTEYVIRKQADGDILQISSYSLPAEVLVKINHSESLILNGETK